MMNLASELASTTTAFGSVTAPGGGTGTGSSSRRSEYRHL